MRKLLYLLASAAVMAGGCSEKKETPAGEGCGTIRIACEADATIDAAAAMAAVQGATRAAAKPDGKDFTLRIRGENFDKSWATVAAYNAEETAYSFPEGRYTITVTYGDPEAEGADKPYYAGATEVEVAARRTSTAQITATIDCDNLDAKELGTMGIPARFDLCNIEGFEDTNGTMHPAEDVREAISALGFPIEDAVKDKPSIRLKIDKMFTGLLTGFPGNNNFILTVTENNGLSTTKTLKYYVPAN